MGINSLEIKDKTNYDFDNICYIDDFDVNSLKITNRLIGFIEKIDGSNDKYLVVVSSLRNKNIINALD